MYDAFTLEDSVAEDINQLLQDLQDPAVMLLLRRRNMELHPSPEAPTVAEMCSVIFGGDWASQEQADSEAVVRRAPVLKMLNDIVLGMNWDNRFRTSMLLADRHVGLSKSSMEKIFQTLDKLNQRE